MQALFGPAIPAEVRVRAKDAVTARRALRLPVSFYTSARLGALAQCRWMWQDDNDLATVQVLCAGTLRQVPNLVDLGLMEHLVEVVHYGALVKPAPQSVHTALARRFK